MKFTLSWLKDHLDTTAGVDEIARTLNAIGLEVEGIEDRGAALAAFRIARVIEAVQHPNADGCGSCASISVTGRNTPSSAAARPMRVPGCSAWLRCRANSCRAPASR
jgi:hypothetical protein